MKRHLKYVSCIANSSATTYVLLVQHVANRAGSPDHIKKQDAKCAEGRESGRRYPLPSRLGDLGKRHTPPLGSGTEPQPKNEKKTILVHFVPENWL